MSTEVFYCGTCMADRPVEGSKVIKIKAGPGYRKIRRCAQCLARREGTAKERDERAKREVEEKRKAAVYSRQTTDTLPMKETE